MDPVVLDAQGAGLAYSVIDMPLTALPLLWWAASSARAPRRSSSGAAGPFPLANRSLQRGMRFGTQKT